MTTDRELLEAAAKAAGYEIDVTHLPEASGAWWIQLVQERRRVWNPLIDDGDALRLAVTLRMDIAHFESSVRADVSGYDDCHEANGNDPYAATRRAIVRAAAELSKQGA